MSFWLNREATSDRITLGEDKRRKKCRKNGEKVAREELSLFFAEKGKRKRRRIGASARAIDRKGKRAGRGGKGIFSEYVATKREIGCV